MNTKFILTYAYNAFLDWEYNWLQLITMDWKRHFTDRDFEKDLGKNRELSIAYIPLYMDLCIGGGVSVSGYWRSYKFLVVGFVPRVGL